MSNCIDLQNLRELSDGDDDFFSEMISLAKEQLEESVSICTSYVNDIENFPLNELAKHLHKTRPSFQQIGADRLYELSDDLEKEIKQSNSASLFPSYFEELKQVQNAISVY